LFVRSFVQFTIQSSQLDLYQRELLQLTEHKAGGAQCFATLAMTERPASSVIFKGKHFGQPYVVHLLTGNYYTHSTHSSTHQPLTSRNSMPIAQAQTWT
jgi:hypothetical protein